MCVVDFDMNFVATEITASGIVTEVPTSHQDKTSVATVITSSGIKNEKKT